MNIDQRCYGYEPAQTQLKKLRARVDELEEAIRYVIPYHAHISLSVMLKLHKALEETTE